MVCLGKAKLEPRNPALWAALFVAQLCLPLTQQLLLSPASPSPGKESKGVKCNNRYKSLAQISLSLASAGGHPCSGIPKAGENGFQRRDQRAWGIKGLPGGKTALMGPRASLREKAEREGKKKEKRERRDREKEKWEKKKIHWGGRKGKREAEDEYLWWDGNKGHHLSSDLILTTTLWSRPDAHPYFTDEETEA